MEISQDPASGSIDVPDGKTNALPQAASARKAGGRLARAAAAAMLTAILLTLAQANAEFLPAAKSAVAAMFFENAGSPAYKGRAAQASGYTLKSILDGAVPLSGIDGSTYFGASDARPQAV